MPFFSCGGGFSWLCVLVVEMSSAERVISVGDGVADTPVAAPTKRRRVEEPDGLDRALPPPTLYSIQPFTLIPQPF